MEALTAEALRRLGEILKASPATAPETGASFDPSGHVAFRRAGRARTTPTARSRRSSPPFAPFYHPARRQSRITRLT